MWHGSAKCNHRNLTCCNVLTVILNCYNDNSDPVIMKTTRTEDETWVYGYDLKQNGHLNRKC